VLRHIAVMMASNPAAQDVDLVLYSLANVSRQLVGGSQLPSPRSFSKRPAFGLLNSADTYVRETHKLMRGRQCTPQFVDMTGSYPASINDLLCDEDPLNDASSTGDNNLEGASAPRRVCSMATTPSEPPPHGVSPQAMHTHADQHGQALANA
jgi:hypothetical protein